MKNKKEFERLKELEANFIEINQSLKKLDEVVKEMKKQLPRIKEFSDYYGSEEWFRHRELEEKREWDQLITTSILSEDLPYNTIVELKELSIELLELATELLR